MGCAMQLLPVRSDSPPVLRFVHELDHPDPAPITIEGSVVRTYDPLRDSPLAGNGVVFYRGPYAPRPTQRRRILARGNGFWIEVIAPLILAGLYLVAWIRWY
jgi:hypothetical protein